MRYLSALALSLVLALSADAAVTITAVESGGSILFTGSGTIDLTDLTLATGSVSGTAGFNNGFSTGVLRMASGGIDIYSGVTSTGPFGTVSSFVSTTTFSGDVFGVTVSGGAPAIEVPTGYVSGAALSGTMSVTGTYASLGFTPGTYTWSWGSGATADSVTLVVAVPEPSSMALCAIALGIGVVHARRRREERDTV